MHSWVFRHRARLSALYGFAPTSLGVTEQIQPGDVVRTRDGVLLGPWGRRAG